jgi:hypothetical protein
MNALSRMMVVWSLVGCAAAMAPSLANGFCNRPVPPIDEEYTSEEQFVDEFVGDVVPPEAPVRERDMLSRSFDPLLFGDGRNIPEFLNDRLEKILQFKVADVSRACRLKDSQKRKLLIAGRGDIKRLVDRIHAEQRPFENVEAAKADADQIQKFRAAAARLKKQVDAGPFGEDSIFAKVLRRDLTAEQFATYVAADEIQRSGGTITTILRGGVEFQEVNLPGGVLNNERLARLTQLPNMRLLVAELSGVTDEGLAALSGLTSLEMLDLSRSQIGSAGLANLAGLKNLQILLLRNTLIGDEALVHLGRLASLRELHLQGTRVTDAGLGHLKGVEQLELLNVGRTRITDDGLIELDLPKFAHLKELGLSHTRIGDAGFDQIGSCPGLQRLIAIGTQLSDSSIRQLRKLKNLRHLLIDQTKITDDGLAALVEIASLETIELSDTAVSDVGLLSLRSLSNLKYLNVANTRITDDGVSEFHRALPDVVVHK